MNLLRNTIITCFSIYAVIALGLLLFGDNEKMVMIGLTGLLLSVIFLFIGIILCIPASSREIGKGLLISAGIILIVGLGVCSMNAAHFNTR